MRIEDVYYFMACLVLDDVLGGLPPFRLLGFISFAHLHYIQETRVGSFMLLQSERLLYRDRQDAFSMNHLYCMDLPASNCHRHNPSCLSPTTGRDHALSTTAPLKAQSVTPHVTNRLI